MNASATTERDNASDCKPKEVGHGHSVYADLDGHSPVIESTAEQTWAEFCAALDGPAFLLAVTGFADL